jgi:hypothetical protein
MGMRGHELTHQLLAVAALPDDRRSGVRQHAAGDERRGGERRQHTCTELSFVYHLHFTL